MNTPYLFFQRSYQVQIAVRDVVVVVLDLRERFLVGLHEPLYVRVFALLYLRRFRLASGV